MLSSRGALIAGATSGLITVVLGAFAAHILKTRLPDNLWQVFEIGIQYQAWHSLALLACGILGRILPSKAVSYAALFFTLGILCFSGSLYALALTGIHWFGPITPIGGVFFILGWVALLMAAFRSV